MTARPNNQVVKKGTFLYDGAVRCEVQIIQTDFRPGVNDDEAPEDDAYGEFYEIKYFWPNQPSCAGGGWHGSLADAVNAVETVVREIQWLD